MVRTAPLPVIVYDGDCAFCSSSARLLATHLRRSPGDFAVEPWQHLDVAALGLTPAECDAMVRWVSVDGIRDAGHVAIALHRLPGGTPACSLQGG